MKFYTNVHRYGNGILYRGYDSGQRVKKKISFKPTLYVKSNKNSDYKTLDGVVVEPIHFESMRAAKEFVDRYDEVTNFTIYGNTNYVAQYIAEEFPNDINFDRQRVRVVNLDIEVASDDGFPEPEDALHPVISIAIKDSILDMFFVWGLGDYDVELTERTDSKIVYTKCKDEKTLLSLFLKHWSDEFNCPDIVTGWNIRTFDIPYLINRMRQILDEDSFKKMSPWTLVEERQVSIRKKQVQIYDLVGIAQLDYLDLFQKFAYSFGPQENYRLDTIANVVLGEKKMSYDEYGSLHNLYKENHQKFIEYNIRDVYLVEKIEEKIAMITLCMTMAYKAGVNYSDTLGTTAIWDQLIHRTLRRDNIIIPSNEEKFKREYDGGYVKEPMCGVHNWVCSFDVNSLYPNIIVQWNMSPETLLKGEVEPDIDVNKCLNGFFSEKAHTQNLSMAATGQYFDNNKQGFMPKIIEQMYDERVIIKKKMIEKKKEYEVIKNNIESKTTKLRLEAEIAQLENQQTAIKILLNSLYGALGNRYFRYFTMEIAEGITITGQFIIKWAEKYVNEFINKILKTNKDYVIAIDTDSVYVCLDDLVNKFLPDETDKTTIVNFLSKSCEKIEKDILEKAFLELKHNCNSYKHRIVMKREGISDRGIWVAKKRYILNVWDNEGVRYAEPKLKIMGIEAIKSSTPNTCREAFKKLFKILISGTEAETQNFIANYKEEFKLLPPEDKAFPRSVSSVREYMDKSKLYKKGTPINSRAAIIYNNLLNKHDIKTLPPIKDGEKIKYIYLNPKNPEGEDVIGFQTILPVEFNMHRYIDNDLQFEKAFLDPAKLILDAIGWKTEEQSSLEDFFS